MKCKLFIHFEFNEVFHHKISKNFITYSWTKNIEIER